MDLNIDQALLIQGIEAIERICINAIETGSDCLIFCSFIIAGGLWLNGNRD